MTTFLTKEQVEQKAPSVFTNTAYEKTGVKYEVIPTWNVITALFDLGYSVTHAMESKTRLKEREGYGRHMLRLRKNNETEINGLYPEIVLINAHDGSSSYQLRAGIFRMVCSNGLIVGDEMFSQKVRHQGNVQERLVQAEGKIIEVFPTAIKKAGEWQHIELNDQQRNVFAESASLLKWDPEDNTQVYTGNLLRPRRYADGKKDLWTTYNVIQENMIRGGISSRNKQTGQRRKTREVGSPYENNRLNTALWNLTEKMASLAS